MKTRRARHFFRRILLAFTLIGTMSPAAAFAHTGAGSLSHDWWRQWSWEPVVVVSLALSGWLYGCGLWTLWRMATPGRGIRRWQALAYIVGWFSLGVALVSPLHPLGRELFCAHMTQHEILMLVAAPLLVFGRPLYVWLWALPLSWRRTVGGWSKRPWVRHGWRALTVPLVAWSVHAVALWVWHAPLLFQATLQSELIHTLQHVSFLLSALLFWWAVFHGGRGWMGYGAATLYVFTTSIHSGALGALLTFSSRLWYPTYRQSTAAWGLTPLEDQQLGGLLMWIPAGLVYLFAGLALMAGWLRHTEAGTRQLRHYGAHIPAKPRPLRNAGIVLGTVFFLVAFTACERDAVRQAVALTGGDIEHGRIAIRYYGCPACHVIPGVPGADGVVGPSLAGIADRVYLGGTVTNTPENMMRWIQHPRDFAPRTTMPDIPMAEHEARDIAGYLYTLR